MSTTPETGLHHVSVVSAAHLHDGATLVSSSPFTVTTSEGQWAYAVSFAVLAPAAMPSDMISRVDVQVHEGEVGIGLLAQGGQSFVVEETVAPADGRCIVELKAASAQPVERIVIRNVSSSRRPSRVTLAGVSIEWFETAEPARELRISSEFFKRFTPFEGPVPRGFWVNWLGIVTRDVVWPFPADVMEAYRERYERCGYPLGDEHVLDWEPMLRAVVAAGDRFTMVALGAGWGRWLTGAAAACRQLGKAYRLTGVEAEPDHFRWMQQHMQDNGIPPDRVRLLAAAASGSTDPCWFPVDDPGWYGQSIRPMPADSEQSGATVLDGRSYRRVDSVTVEDILDDVPVDYLHMDIQGTEYDFLARNPSLLTRSIRMINVGTHSASIERRLRSLFVAEGWEAVQDFTLGSTADLVVDDESAGHVTFGDGVQVWRNPRL